MTKDIDAIYKVAKTSVLEAGAAVVTIFPKIQTLKNKSLGNDVLTTADAKSEEIIISAIKKNFPEHSIYSEEMGSNNLESDYKWFIDPLDGSKHISRGLPFFCITLAVSYKRKVILGITYVPLLNQFFEAKDGEGAFLNGEKISVSETSTLEKAMIDAEFPSRNFKVEWSSEDYNSAFADFEKVIKNSFRVRMIGSGPIGLAYTAMGGYDSYVRFQPYSIEDVIAGYILVKEAGGKVLDFEGHDIDILEQSGGKFIASNPKISDKILEILKTK